MQSRGDVFRIFYFLFASASGNLNHCSQNSRILSRYGNFFLFFPPGFIFPIFVWSLGITRGKKTSQSNRVQVSYNSKVIVKE